MILIFLFFNSKTDISFLSTECTLQIYLSISLLFTYPVSFIPNQSKLETKEAGCCLYWNSIFVSHSYNCFVLKYHSLRKYKPGHPTSMMVHARKNIGSYFRQTFQDLAQTVFLLIAKQFSIRCKFSLLCLEGRSYHNFYLQPTYFLESKKIQHGGFEVNILTALWIPAVETVSLRVCYYWSLTAF